MIDARIVPDEPEELTPGEAIAGMMLNGLGFANRPLSLPPPFFANKPLDLLLRDGVQAERCNCFKLGRTLDEVQAYGCALLLSARAFAVWVQAGMAQRLHHLATPSFSLRGDSLPESDEQAMTMPHGSAKDHRPDVQQAVLALRVSQDGGVPLVRKSWPGKASATQIVQERAPALMTAFANAPTPPSLVAEATLYPEATAATLAQRGFLTRIPATRKLVSQVIRQALPGDTWHALEATTRSQGRALGHSGMAQRGRGVSAQAAMERAEASISQAPPREAEAIEKPRFH